MNPYLANAVETLSDIGQMISVVFGRQQALVVGPGTVVSTEVDVSKPETLVPLLTGIVVALSYTQAIEFIGCQVAKAIGAKSKKIEAFASSWCESIYFGMQIVISYRLFSNASWFWPSGWEGSMEDGRKGVLAGGLDGVPPYHTTRDMRAYYVCEFGYYTAMLVMIFTKERKKDFWEMVFHHVVTSFLIGLSYTFWHLRIGVIVMMLHNLFDPFLHIAKCAHYAFKGKALHVIADISFAVGAIVFLISRLVLYPRAIYVAWMYSSPVGRAPILDASGDEWTLKLLLCFLYPVHVFWFFLILKVAKKALLRGEVQGDERSDSEGDEEPKKSK